MFPGIYYSPHIQLVGLFAERKGADISVRMIREDLAAASTAAGALTARLLAAHAGAAAVVPEGDPVSTQTPVRFSASSSEHAVVVAEGVHELGRSEVGVAESTVSDVVAASSSVEVTCRNR